MRIAYISADRGVPIFGTKGCSIHAQEVLRAMLKRGAEVDLFSPSLSGDRAAGLESLNLHALPLAPKGELSAREQFSLAANSELRCELEHAGPFDLVYERYSLWSFAGMAYARGSAIPAILEVNAPLIEEQAEHRGLIDRPGAEGAAAQAFKDASVLVAVSEEVGAYLERFPEARGKVRVVPNGVNPERFPPSLKPSLPAAPGAFTVGFVGTLKPWHGLGSLVEAFARLRQRHPEARLLIVGDGPEAEKMQAHLSKNGLIEACHFTGAVSANEVPGLLASMDVGVAPYPKLSHFYFSPLKVYEYMAAGLPIVASRVGQLQNIIQEEVNGLLTTPGDSAELAEALERLKSDPDLRARLGTSARVTVLRDHTWYSVVERIFDLASAA